YSSAAGRHWLGSLIQSSRCADGCRGSPARASQAALAIYRCRCAQSLCIPGDLEVKHPVRLLLGVLCLAAAASLCAQGLDPATLLKLPTSAWPTYNGDYSGRRYSPLTQINSTNVNNLGL